MILYLIGFLMIAGSAHSTCTFSPEPEKVCECDNYYDCIQLRLTTSSSLIDTGDWMVDNVENLNKTLAQLETMLGLPHPKPIVEPPSTKIPDCPVRKYSPNYKKKSAQVAAQIKSIDILNVRLRGYARNIDNRLVAIIAKLRKQQQYECKPCAPCADSAEWFECSSAYNCKPVSSETFAPNCKPVSSETSSEASSSILN